jgi:hypothetical protein
MNLLPPAPLRDVLSRVSHPQANLLVTLRHTLISPSSGKTVPKTLAAAQILLICPLLS